MKDAERKKKEIRKKEERPVVKEKKSRPVNHGQI
jgi:hypothetical protein